MILDYLFDVWQYEESSGKTLLLTLLCKSSGQLEAWSDFVIFAHRGPKSLLGRGMDRAAVPPLRTASPVNRLRFGESITACIQLDRARYLQEPFPLLPPSTSIDAREHKTLAPKNSSLIFIRKTLVRCDARDRTLTVHTHNYASVRPLYISTREKATADIFSAKIAFDPQVLCYKRFTPRELFSGGGGDLSPARAIRKEPAIAQDRQIPCRRKKSRGHTRCVVFPHTARACSLALPG